MKFSTKITSGIAAASAAALGVGLLAFTPGLSAAFSSSSAAAVDITVGEFGCEFSKIPNTPGVTVYSDGTATISLDKIQSSAPSQQTKQVNVKNTGTMPLMANITGQRTSGSSVFDAVPVSPVVVQAGQREAVDLGIKWGELENKHLGTDASVKYTLKCTEAPGASATSSFKDYSGAGTQWNADGTVTLVKGDASPFAAQIMFDGLVGQSLPATEPVYKNSAESDVIWLQIRTTEGIITKYSPNNAGWNIPVGSSSWTSSWGDVLDWAAGAGNPTITRVDILLGIDAKNTDEVDISCVQFGGNYIVGTGC